ncbi:hypothetical protein AC249_AIPGENE3846 [Exaiptasia diaphana]|nr:hypothetical protein AC249_AIPGENE3846 [Exaiptasia diaphana]
MEALESYKSERDSERDMVTNFGRRVYNDTTRVVTYIWLGHKNRYISAKDPWAPTSALVMSRTKNRKNVVLKHAFLRIY